MELVEHYAALLGLAIGVFATSNLDDLFILLGFCSDPTYRVRQVALGQLLGIGTLYAASVAASLLSLVVSPTYIGFLGLLPILIGFKKIWELRRSAPNEVAEDSTVKPGRWNALTVAAVTIADGATT